MSRPEASFWRDILWQQFGAATDMLGNAITACPDELWGGRSGKPEFWTNVFHTLFYLDLYLSGVRQGFAPPAPFGMTELEDGVMPERVYSKDELQRYLAHCREKCRRILASMNDEAATKPCAIPWLPELSMAELHIYNLRHVQHHVGQLNMLLRQGAGLGSRWVKRTES